MSKTSETKDKILKLLASGDKRLTDIYPQLGLSPATVSQHLKELKEMQFIKETEDSHFKNMKYYTLSNRRKDNSVETNPDKILKPQMLKISIGVVAIAAIVVAALLLFISSNGLIPAQSAPSSPLSILLTDPPHVPIGTQSLNITYASIEVRITNSTSSHWIGVNATGTINLLSLVNVSTVLASVEVPTNAIIDMAAFNITYAEITVNNVSYTVNVPNNRIVANISKSAKFNGNSSLLLDLSPTILTLYTDNATLFELAPSLNAMMVNVGQKQLVSNLGQQGGVPPTPFMLSKSILESLSALKGSITIVGGSINSNGNDTHISIIVKDTSNKSIKIGHVLVFGNESLYLNANAIKMHPMPAGPSAPVPFPIIRQGPPSGLPMPFNGINGHMGNFPARGNATATSNGRFHIPGSFNGNMPYNGTYSNHNFTRSKNGNYIYHDNFVNNGGFNSTSESNSADPHSWNGIYNWSTGQINASLPPAPNGAHSGMQNGQWVSIGWFFNIPMEIGKNESPAQMANGIRNAYAICLNKENFGVINLIVNDNGTLSQLPNWGYVNLNQSGFILNPGQNATLSFNGTVSLGTDFITANFKYGSSYAVDVVGDDGAYASYNITAS